MRVKENELKNAWLSKNWTESNTFQFSIHVYFTNQLKMQ